MRVELWRWRAHIFQLSYLIIGGYMAQLNVILLMCVFHVNKTKYARRECACADYVLQYNNNMANNNIGSSSSAATCDEEKEDEDDDEDEEKKI